MKMVRTLTLRKDNGDWKGFIGSTIDSADLASLIDGLSNLTSNEFSDDIEAANVAELIFSMLDGEKKTFIITEDSSGFIISSTKVDICFSSGST